MPAARPGAFLRVIVPDSQGPRPAVALPGDSLNAGGPSKLLSMRVMVNFALRDCWSVHCVSKDALTCISPTLLVPDQPTLIRLLRYVGATDAELKKVDERIREWGRGSVIISLAPGRRNLLRIRAPWSDGLMK